MNKYNYSTLQEIKNSGESYNFYGVIIDATYPNPEEDRIEYICSLKVIDESINHKINQSNFDDSVINIIIKSNSKENLPYIYGVGEIIRVHRGHFVRNIHYIIFSFLLILIILASKK